jgi:hypothetical protein
MSIVHQAQQGFLTIAQNNADVDYLQLAYVQAMSIKLTMPGSLYAIIVDIKTSNLITENHRKVFDYIITLEHDIAKDDNWKLSNEWQVFRLTPFKETIKLESDLIFTRDISHWWHAFRLRNIVLSTGCRDYQQNLSTTRKYRQLFDDNKLPDVYSGLMYFRYTQEAATFFSLAEQVFRNWEYIKESVLLSCYDDIATTDVVYALVTKIIGEEQCTIPSLDWINFVHMKPSVNKWQNTPWSELVLCEMDLPMIRINNINQYHPLHYHDKTWVTSDLIKEYEKWI